MEFESCLNELQHWTSANLCHILGGKLERCTRRVAPMSPLRVPTWATSPSSSRHSQVTPWMSPPVDPQRAHQRSHNGQMILYMIYQTSPLPTTRRSRLAKLVEDHWPCTLTLKEKRHEFPAVGPPKNPAAVDRSTARPLHVPRRMLSHEDAAGGAASGVPAEWSAAQWMISCTAKKETGWGFWGRQMCFELYWSLFYIIIHDGVLHIVC